MVLRYVISKLGKPQPAPVPRYGAPGGRNPGLNEGHRQKGELALAAPAPDHVRVAAHFSKGINVAQQEVRRALMMYAAVTGSFDLPLVLAYMSVVKDVERIGDYAKNIFDLAAEGVDLSAADDRDELYAIAKRVSEMITESGKVFAAEDVERARALSEEGDSMLDDFDQRVHGLLLSEDAGAVAVPRALLFRYLKRIVSHLMNLLSAVFMPIDQLDYFDEPDRDSASRRPPVRSRSAVPPRTAPSALPRRGCG